MDLLFDRLESPLGALTVVWKDHALRALEFDDHDPRLQRLLKAHYQRFELRATRSEPWLRLKA